MKPVNEIQEQVEHQLQQRTLAMSWKWCMKYTNNASNKKVKSTIEP